MIATAIQKDIGHLLSELSELNIGVVESTFDATNFGNYIVALAGPNDSFAIVRDKGQYLIDGDVNALKRMGLWRAYDSREDFRTAVLAYVRAVV